MKTVKFLSLLLAIIFMMNTSGQSQTVKKKSPYPIWSLSPVGGIAFPVGKFGESYKSGPTFGLDISYRVNREVGIYVKGGYYIFPSKIAGSDADGKYLEYTAGPRYFFTSRNLKSSFFLEVGLGGYSFKQDAHVVDSVNVAEYTSTDFGVNAGMGATLNLGASVDLIIKLKYHNILTTDGSSSFVAPMLGIDIRL